MSDYITKKQKAAIEDAAWLGDDVYRERLHEYTGIKAKPYVPYQYYDKNGDYVGDSNQDSLDDILEAAQVEVI